MPSLSEYFPWYGWLALLLCGGLAAVPFFVPPSLVRDLGLSTEGYIALVAAVEFVAAVGVGSLVVYYRNTETDESEDSEWRFDP
jgi:hypothetical protein